MLDDRAVIQRILLHLGLWEQGVRVHAATGPSTAQNTDPWYEDPFPDYDTAPVMAYANG